MSRVKDMTVGQPWKLMLAFAFPLILTNIGQQCYSIVDAAIVGRGVGVKALAAVGSTDWSHRMILWTIAALTHGFSTFVARYFGQKDMEAMNRVIGASFVLCGTIGALFTILGVGSVRPLLLLLNTPEDILDQAASYLFIIFAGTLIVTFYNMTTSILRALGDGKTPMFAMVISSLLNIALDLLLVLVFHWGIVGAAAATVTAQCAALVYNLIQLNRIDCIHLKKEYLKFNRRIYSEMLRFSLPLALQHMVIVLGGMFLQASINLQGSIFVAGYAAGNKLQGLLVSSANSLNIAFTTFMSQNFGAGNADRVKRGLKNALAICVMFSTCIGGVMLFASRFLIRIFVDVREAGAAESMEIAHGYLTVLSAGLIFLFLLYAFRSTLEAMGNSFWSFISGLVEFAARVSCGNVFLHLFGAGALYFAEPMAWVGSVLILTIPCLRQVRKMIGRPQTTDKNIG